MFKANNEWDEREFPSAYIITFRTYGTWLHGDERGSFRRIVSEKYLNSKAVPPNKKLRESMHSGMKHKNFLLTRNMRKEAELVINELCVHRGFHLHAVNVRRNHIHLVVTASTKPKLLVNSMKSYITRRLRQKGLVGNDERIWSRGNSSRYLWKPREMSMAVEYVLYEQGDSFNAVTEMPKE